MYLFSKEMKVCEAACLKISNDAAPTAFEMKRNILLTCCILLCDWQKNRKNTRRLVMPRKVRSSFLAKVFKSNNRYSYF